MKMEWKVILGVIMVVALALCCLAFSIGHAADRQDVEASAEIANGHVDMWGSYNKEFVGPVSGQDRRSFEVRGNTTLNAIVLYSTGSVDSFAIEADASRTAVPSVEISQKAASTRIDADSCITRATGVNAEIAFGQIAGQSGASGGAVHGQAEAPLIQGGKITAELIEWMTYREDDVDDADEATVTTITNVQGITADGNFTGTVTGFSWLTGDPNFPGERIADCDSMLKGTVCPWLDQVSGTSCLDSTAPLPICLGEIQ